MTEPEREPAPDAVTGSILATLDAETRARLVAGCESVILPRGGVLVAEGDAADDLYIVVSGRFAVMRSDRSAVLTEIATGETIGEIAFFAGGLRTATVSALRDSIALRLPRAHFDAIAASRPELQRAIAAMLARRLAATSAGHRIETDQRPRTIAIVAAGSRPVAAQDIARLVAAFDAVGSTIALDAASTSEYIPAGADLASGAATEALNALESRADTIIYIAGADLTPWAAKAVRQADLALIVAHHAGDATPGELENHALALLGPSRLKLLLLHPTHHDIAGTARWLAPRHGVMHHHAALDRPGDFARVARFVAGTARGLVAGGGGAFCMAHVGLYEALAEAGHAFDMFGGTSGGSAMTAAFAIGAPPDAIEAAIRLAFVTRKAMRRYTIPRYGLLDHTHYDAELAALFGGRRIEDLWRPFFSVAANLSENRIEVLREGPVWQAVRASSAIPVLLPPFYTADGDMLVDGGLMDNVPVKIMHDLKRGPNVVMSLEAPKLARFPVDYARLPSRNALLRALVTPFRRGPLPPAPGIGTVLLRALVAHRQDYERHLRPGDLHLKPPLPADMSLLDWHRHAELRQGARTWARAALRRAP